MKSIGIDICINGATIVEVSADRSGYEIVRGEFFPINPNDPGNWELDLLQGLKYFRETFDLDNSVVCVGLSQKLISTRNLNFPFSRRIDILKSLPFELDEELPFGSEDAYVDAKTVAIAPGETSVLAFATPQKEVLALVELLARVQIDPDYISAEASAFANLFEDWMNGSFLQSTPESIPSPLVMRLYFRHDSTLVTFFQDRQMVAARTISWGERNIILELMKAYNYPYDQAASLIPEQMKLLMMMHGASANDIKLSSLIELTLKDLSQQIRHTIIDIQDKFKSPVGSAHLLGPISLIENINAHLTKSVGLPFNSESLASEVFQPKQVQTIAHLIERAPIAIGYALEALKRPKNPAINLRQGESLKRNKFWEKTWSKWGQAIVLTSVAYGLYIVYGISREQIAVDLDDTTYSELQKHAGTIAGLKGLQATPDKVERYIVQEKEKVKNAKIFEKVQDIEPAMKVINMLSGSLPSNQKNSYNIRKVNVKNSIVFIEGVAQQKNTVDMIKKKLEGLSANNKIANKPSTSGPGDGVPFAFSFTLKGSL